MADAWASLILELHLDRPNVNTIFTISRPFWHERIENCWRKAPIVWLSGVRRVGKTTLAETIENAEFLNCDLPSSHHLLADPETFYRSLSKPRLILDEVHQLPDPSRLLKIGADAFPKLKILATGSSTLAATHKFRDSLAGRKRNLHLVPVRHDELAAFGIRDLRQRLFRGGLPPALLAEDYDPGFYSEWLDSYYARDVQELFRVEKRGGFLKLVESVLRLSGGQMEATALSQLCGLSRPTVLTRWAERAAMQADTAAAHLDGILPSRFPACADERGNDPSNVNSASWCQ